MPQARSSISSFLVAGALAAALVATGTAQTQPAQARQFESPDVAVAALLDACAAHDVNALRGILGPEFEEKLDTTDDAAERTRRTEFVAAARTMMRIERHGESEAELIVGERAWPFPIPLVKDARGWHFDTAAGVEEIINRRIGANELNAIEASRAYLGAQVEYARKDHDGDEVLEYAQRLRSTPGSRDGLYWEVAPESGELPSPLGPLVAGAGGYLDESVVGAPFKGYYFKVLSRQGEYPPGDLYEYVINGNMIAGFALVASPAEYGKTGIMTFVVSHQGKVYEKDLGERTEAVAKRMTWYNPDESWTLVGK